jgi:Lipocalin-like domain
MNLSTTALTFMSLLLLEPSLLGNAVAQTTDLVGTWKLVSLTAQAVDTKETKDALGPKPFGRMIVTPTGFITSYRVADGREPAQTEGERAQLLQTMAAWTGRYRMEGNQLLVKIESSWNENDTGKEFPRTIMLEGNKLTITLINLSSNFFAGRPAYGREVWERED